MYEYNEEDGGIQFDPYDDELIQNYLIPKLEGKPCREITVKDVYSKEPWLLVLDHPMGSFFKKNEWYYFATRTQVSKKMIGCGKKSKRKITREEDSGHWKANAKGDIRDKETNMVIGTKQTLAFVRSGVKKKKRKRGDGTSCDDKEDSWIMTEYMLPEGGGRFHELVICKIHVIKYSKEDGDHNEASTSSNHHHHHELVLASSLPNEQQQHPINEAHRHEASTYLVDQETFLAPFLKQQPSNNIISEIQENNKDDHEALVPYHHDFVADSFTTQQPMNEAYGHVPEIPQIGSEKNVQGFDETATRNEINGEERCDNLVSERLHNYAPLVGLGSEQEAEGGGVDWLQDYTTDLWMTVNGSSMPMEEHYGTLIYNTSTFVDQDLLDQFATLRPQEKL